MAPPTPTPSPSQRKLSRSPSSFEGSRPHAAALEAVGTRPRRAQRRPTTEAHYTLTNHAKAYIEGNQVASGYDFMYSLLAAGTSISTPAQPRLGLLAPPAYLALASSLVADPKFTTKARSKGEQVGSDAALRYLQCVHSTIDGPAYSTIRKAFTFPEERNRRRAPGHRSAAGSVSPGQRGDIERIAGEAANEQSLWYRADDFWHIVGWAFNCSVACRRRWDRWRLWLQVMLDFLEADWGLCVKQSKSAVDEGAILRHSLLWHYIAGDTGATSTNRAQRRRMVKAILATATPESIREYTEVWTHETTKQKPKKKLDHPLDVVDFETGELADYGSDEDMQDVAHESESYDEGLHSPTDLRDRAIYNMHDSYKSLGGQDAIDLRQRLIALLAEAAQALPTHFTTVIDVFDSILEDFSQLPINIFNILISTLRLPGPLQVAFYNNLFHPLISGSVSHYLRYEPTQEHFESKLLLLKGSSQSLMANAKITLLVEQIFMYMISHNALAPTTALRKAVESGIEARHNLSHSEKRRKKNAREDEQAKELMIASSERLLALLEVLEISTGRPAQAWKPKGKRTSTSALLSFGSGSPLSSAPGSDTEDG